MEKAILAQEGREGVPILSGFLRRTLNLPELLNIACKLTAKRSKAQDGSDN